MATVGRAVTAVLDHWDECADRSVRVQDVAITQNEVVDMAREITARDSGKVWTVTHVDTAQRACQATEDLAKGVVNPMLFFALALRGTFGKNCGVHFKKTDNDLLGIKNMDKDELKEVIRQAIYE